MPYILLSVAIVYQQPYFFLITWTNHPYQDADASTYLMNTGLKGPKVSNWQPLFNKIFGVFSRKSVFPLVITTFNTAEPKDVVMRSTNFPHAWLGLTVCGINSVTYLGSLAHVIYLFWIQHHIMLFDSMSIMWCLIIAEYCSKLSFQLCF